MHNIKELTQYEKKDIQGGGGIISDIHDVIRAYKRIKDFFSGRPQV
ncbi:hypothetical protein [Zobellia russellii]